MKLLVVTQVVDVNDPVLGFFHQWLMELSKRVESLTVICLNEGEHTLPQNVRVYSLGKEKGRRSTISYATTFIALAWKLRREYDTVFVHMNPEYLSIAGPLWRLSNKKIGLWYMHKKVSWRLRIGVLFADYVFTASPRSMRITTHKKQVVGHGIVPGELLLAPPHPPLSLLTVGRISRIKRAHILIETLRKLHDMGIDARLVIVGGAAGKDGALYEKELKSLVENLALGDSVFFEGPRLHSSLSNYFTNAHIFLHASDTGSLDKASLEPLAAGIPLVTSDVELASVGIRAIVASEPSANAFASAVQAMVKERLWDNTEVREEAHNYVLAHHELSRLIDRVLAILGSNYDNTAGE